MSACRPAPVESLSNHYLFMQVCVFTVLGHHYVGYSGLWGFFCSEHSRGCLGHSLHVLQSGSGRLCAGHHHPACGAWTPHLLPIPLSTQKEAESWLIKSALWPLVRKASVQLIQKDRSMQSLPDMLQNRQSICLSEGWFLLFDQSKAMPGLLLHLPRRAFDRAQVKHDERTGRYRDLTANLKEYINVNEIPPVRCRLAPSS